MDGLMNTIDFKVMSFMFKIRDLLQPRINVLNEVGIEPGYHVLDFGCGPGSYIVPLADLVGKAGKIYALDMHPLAIRAVKSLADRKWLTNVETIHSDGATGLPDNSLDAVLLYDTLHDLQKPDEVLAELHRVLKPRGILSLSDHHLKGEEIVAKVTSGGLFALAHKGEKTHNFSRVGGRNWQK